MVQCYSHNAIHLMFYLLEFIHNMGFILLLVVRLLQVVHPVPDYSVEFLWIFKVYPMCAFKDLARKSKYQMEQVKGAAEYLSRKVRNKITRFQQSRRDHPVSNRVLYEHSIWQFI